VDDRLYRSPNDRVIAGVAGGMATWLNLDPSLVRVAWVLLGVVSGGLFVLIYIVMMIVVPLPPVGWTPRPRGSAPGPVWPAGTPGPETGTPGAASGSPESAAGVPGALPGWQAGGGSAWGSPPATPPAVNTGNAGILFGAILVLLGFWFLVERYVNVDWQLLWPLLVIALGVVVIGGALRRAR
jgi:phage shock protein PspC (stress-responsive transcriptional regulator)